MVKAAKMIGYLEHTHQKVEAIVNAARQGNADVARIEAMNQGKDGRRALWIGIVVMLIY